MTTTSQGLIQQFPHLLSPAHLGKATDVDWQTPKHLQINNDWLVQVFQGVISRLMVNMPYQHGKSQLNTRFFPAWYLLLRPDTRILIVGHEYDFAVTEYGLQIKDIFNKWGKDFGLEIREDAKAKGSWKVEGYKGGVVCRGWQGGLSGRPADLFIIDDLIKDPRQALSETILEAHWRFYMTVVFGRLRRRTRLVMVGTRWTRGDLFGRVLKQAARTGEKWSHLKFKALAEADDPLGRQPGEALWPEAVPKEQHEIAKAEWGKWFKAGWQQEPEDEEGSYFQPSKWPLYGDVGYAYTIERGDGGSRIVPYEAVLRFVVTDWGMSQKKKANFTCVGMWGLLPDGRLLLLHVRSERIKLENVVAFLAEECRTWRPSFGLAEAEGFQASLLLECRRYTEIPELRPMKTQGMNKVQRAVPAIVMGQNGRILLPDLAVCLDPRTTAVDPDWLDRYKSRLAAFTGIGDEKDDEVDMTAYAAQEATLLRGSVGLGDGGGPCLLTPGKAGGW